MWVHVFSLLSFYTPHTKKPPSPMPNDFRLLHQQSCGPLAHRHLPRSRPLTTERATGAKGSDGLWGINRAEKEQAQSVSPVYWPEIQSTDTQMHSTEVIYSKSDGDYDLRDDKTQGAETGERRHSETGRCRRCLQQQATAEQLDDMEQGFTATNEKTF